MSRHASTRLRACLLLTFVQSFATICVERGIFFYAHRHLGFSEVGNLWLAMSFGAPYVLGALRSHALTERFGERRILLCLLAGMGISDTGLGLVGSNAPAVFGFNIALGLLNGATWPIIESYVSAGRDPRNQTHSLGAFNVSWALSVPLALAFTGPVNVLMPAALFLVPAILNLLAILIARRFTANPRHVPDDHPHRPSAGELQRLSGLLGAARWLMLMSYSLMWILSALIPNVFTRLDVSDELAPGLSGALDTCRLGIFFTFGVWHGWSGRVWPLAVAIFAIPVGFVLVTAGPTLPVVMVGLVICGVSVGVVYFCALHYAMLVKNAAVHASGGHEAMIGAGFTLGPILGLAAMWVEPLVGGRLSATGLSIAPLIAVCAIFSLRQLSAVSRGMR